MNWIQKIKTQREESIDNRKKQKDKLGEMQKNLDKLTKEIRLEKLKNQLDNHFNGDHTKDDQLKSLTEHKKSVVLNAQKFSMDRFLKDNERIWTVTTIFLPLSLAGLSQLKDKAFTTVILLGLGSIFLITFWFIATEKLRKFQDDNLRSVNILDLYLGIDTDFALYEDNKIKDKAKEVDNYRKTVQKAPWYTVERFDSWLKENKWVHKMRKIPIQQARLYMYYLVTLVWIVAMAHATYREFCPKVSQPLKIQIGNSRHLQ